LVFVLGRWRTLAFALPVTTTKVDALPLSPALRQGWERAVADPALAVASLFQSAERRHSQKSPYEESEIPCPENYESGFALTVAPKPPGPQNLREISRSAPKIPIRCNKAQIAIILRNCKRMKTQPVATKFSKPVPFTQNCSTWNNLFPAPAAIPNRPLPTKSASQPPRFAWNYAPKAHNPLERPLHELPTPPRRGEPATRTISRFDGKRRYFRNMQSP